MSKIDEQFPRVIDVYKIKHRHSLVAQSGLKVTRALRIVPHQLAMVQLDVNSKRNFSIFAVGSDGDIPDIMLCPLDDDGNEVPMVGETSNLTVVKLPEFKGWSIWSVDAGKGCVRVSLYKD